MFALFEGSPTSWHVVSKETGAYCRDERQPWTASIHADYPSIYPGPRVGPVGQTSFMG